MRCACRLVPYGDLPAYGARVLRRARKFDQLDAAIAAGDAPFNVTLDNPRRDRRAIRAGGEIVGHHTRESFMRATGRCEVRCLFCSGFADAPDHAGSCPKREPLSKAEVLAGLRAAYGVGATAIEGLASDRDIRACTRRGCEQ